MIPEQSTSSLSSDSQLFVTLFALALGQASNKPIHTLRRELWKATGNPSFLSLFPLIPLLWVPKGSRIPQTLRFPALRHSLEVRPQPEKSESSLFLPIDDEKQLVALESQLRDWYQKAENLSTIHRIPIPTPFPARQASVYLGTDSPAARQRLIELGMEITRQSFLLKDFRLVTVDMQTKSSWITDLSYQVWQDRHLVVGER
jgi:hypothetical protein